MRTKDKVFQILQDPDHDFVSGEAIADKLGISRNSVWKAIKALRQEGYEIEAITNKGYHLKNADVLSREQIIALLGNRADALNIKFYDELESTNQTAKIMAVSGEPDSTIVIAASQKGGRGRNGTSFYSPRGGMYISLLIRPLNRELFKKSATDFNLTRYAAETASRTINTLTGKNTVIHEPNDIYLGDLKVGGVLTETMADLETGRAEFSVIGIGIEPFGDGDGKPMLNQIAAQLIIDILDGLDREYL